MTHVETYEIDEVKEETIEVSAEAKALCEQLGLGGQVGLFTKNTDTEEALSVRVPYPKATTEQLFVFKMLCPTPYRIDTYDRAPIPLRVLQIYSHAKDTDFFKRFEVWDKEDESVKDPVLVAFASNTTQTWRDDIYLLARWGEELEAWGLMLRKAIAIAKQQWQQEAVKAKAQLDEFIRTVHTLTDKEVLEKGAGHSVYVRL